MSKEEEKNIERLINELYLDTEFIESAMSFYSYQDFKRNCLIIKKIYLAQGFRTKKLFKWYVYSRVMSIKQKDLIWDFLNNNDSIFELDIEN